MSIEQMFNQVNPGSMAARDPRRSGRKRPRHPITAKGQVLAMSEILTRDINHQLW
jgi:hypothetical protein